MNRLALQGYSSSHRSSARGNWILLRKFLELGGEPIVCRELEHVSRRTPYGCRIGLAQRGRGFDQCAQHGLQVERRAANDLEHVGGGGLLLQRFAHLT